MRIGTRARLRLRLLVPVTLVASLALPMAAAAETEPTPDRQASIEVVSSFLAYAGHPFTVTGRLVSAGERSSPTNTLHVVRTVEGVTTALPDIITAEDGTFTLGDSYGKKGVGAYYRISWDGDDAHDPTSRILSVGFRPVPVTLSLQTAPASPKALDPVTFSGEVSFGAGEQVSSPVELSVHRGPPWDRVELPPVTTRPDGTFEFTDLGHGGSWIYEVTYPGDDAHESRTAIKGVDVRLLNVQVSVELAAGESVRWGLPSRYVGRVTALEGPPISEPLSVNVSSSGTCGGHQTSMAVQSKADGSFAADVLPGCPYDSTVTAQHLYDADRAFASGTSASAAVGTGVPSIYLRPDFAGDGPAARYGSPVTVETGVRWAVGRGLLEIYAKPYAQNKVLLKRVWLTDGQGPTFTYYPKRRTVLTAVYHGDERVVAGSKTQVLYVHPDLQVSVGGADALRDNWFLYRHRNDIPRVEARSKPAHPGLRLNVVLQKYINNSWRTVSSRWPRQDRGGEVETAYQGLDGKGNRYRVRTSWSGDADHVAATSYWVYFRFTA